MENSSQQYTRVSESTVNNCGQSCTVGSLKILSLNVCGIKSKLNCPEFIDLIKSHDVIGVQETKLDDIDCIQLPGYEIICKNRKKMSRYRSGGIAVLVNSKFSPFIKFHENKSSLVQWFTISKRLTNLESDILCGNIYIPPCGSKYAHEDPYLEIQTEFNHYCTGSNDVIMFGDYNSRTANLPDFLAADKFTSHLQNGDSLYNESMEVLECLNSCNFPLERKSADTSSNIYGKQLIEFCQGNDLIIVNGRLGEDSINPRLTCKDSSTIDYFICSSKLVHYLNDFSVFNFSPLFSDSHSAISLNINVQYAQKNTTNHDHSNAKERIKLWDCDKAHLFEANCDRLKIQSISDQLECMSHNSISKTEIDTVVKDIECLFQTTSNATFGTKKIKNSNTTNNNKPWYNFECKAARNTYHKIRKLYNKYKSEHYKNLLKTVSKSYKTTINRSIKRYKNEKIEKLRRLKKSDPKEFWRILNDDKSKHEASATLDDLYNFFKELNQPEVSANTATVPTDEVFAPLNEEINKEITESEILKVAKALKNNKAAGIDVVLNEHIKATIHIMLPIYVKLFNIIFDTGFVPESWLLGNILPIYKNKGDIQNPENYRPITLLSCLGKLFTAIINNRLNDFATERNLISDSQTGFRKGFSTTENIFIIKSLIDILKSRNKKLFCAFVDFKQAFDTVWRDGLWYKLDYYGINGKCLNLIKNMYANIKSRIKNKEGLSLFFACCNGVRQGENLSPFLFTMFLNDLHHYFNSKNTPGIRCEVDTEDVYVFLKMFVLLYADDTVIFGEDATDLQHALCVFQTYCSTWKLTVNISKTKVLIFSRGKRHGNYRFTFDNTELEIVKEYKYLGIFLTSSGSFNKTKTYLAQQANKALFSLFRKTRNLNLSIDLQIELFNKTVKPILLYGSEIWGFGNCDAIERIQLKFIKYALNLKKSTPSFMIYGELGMKPITLDIQARVISFWSKLVSDEDHKLSTLIYKITYEMHKTHKIKSTYIDNVQRIINSCGFSRIWQSQSLPNPKWFNLAISQKLHDQFIQNWSSLV